jgi:hypothetical protein
MIRPPARRSITGLALAAAVLAAAAVDVSTKTSAWFAVPCWVGALIAGWSAVVLHGERRAARAEQRQRDMCAHPSAAADSYLPVGDSIDDEWAEWAELHFACCITGFETRGLGHDPIRCHRIPRGHTA